MDKLYTTLLVRAYFNIFKYFRSTGMKVMITTGFPHPLASKTEIIDVLKGKICSNIADFPLKIDGAVGVNLEGTAIVCGGEETGSWKYSKKCYKFTNGGWQKIASMKEARKGAAGIIYKKKWYVFGGWQSGRLKTSEIVSENGGVSKGQELPNKMYDHTFTTINSTFSVLSGGNYLFAFQNSTLFREDFFSTETLYYNHKTNAFTNGPTLLKGRSAHGSATCVDKVTNMTIPIVAGGKTSSGHTRTTELLIGGKWKAGTIHYSNLNCFLFNRKAQF